MASNVSTSLSKEEFEKYFPDTFSILKDNKLIDKVSFGAYYTITHTSMGINNCAFVVQAAPSAILRDIYIEFSEEKSYKKAAGVLKAFSDKQVIYGDTRPNEYILSLRRELFLKLNPEQKDFFWDLGMSKLVKTIESLSGGTGIIFSDKVPANKSEIPKDPVNLGSYLSYKVVEYLTRKKIGIISQTIPVINAVHSSPLNLHVCQIWLWIPPSRMGYAFGELGEPTKISLNPLPTYSTAAEIKPFVEKVKNNIINNLII